MQAFKGTADSASMSFHAALEKLARTQVDRSNTPFAVAVDAQLERLNKTLLAGWAGLTAANEQLSRSTFVPLSNKLTKLTYEINK